jgi:class 3 adenylate cyclase
MAAPVRFLTTRDGVRIAYCTHGDGPPLLFVRGWIGHLELHWSDPAFRSYFEPLARHYRLIRYDVRGNGLSQRDVPDIDLEALVLDLEALIEQLELTDITLYGTTFGGPIAVTYVARHPERIARLILDGTYARGQDINTPERQDAIIRMIRHFPEFAFQRFLGPLTHPEPEQAAYRHVSPQELVSPAVAAQLYALCYQIDVSALLPQIQVPTLVLHRRGSRAIPFLLGREVASLLPNAHFAPLEGSAHNLWEGDAAAALAAIGDFLRLPIALAPAPRAATGQPPLTILFTDIESSTALTQRFGDARAQEVLRTHNTIVRTALVAHSGSEIKHTGDGIMASFPSASRALECAIAIQRAVAARVEEHPQTPLRVRIGLNAGEPVAEDEDLFGTAVQLARRICDRAEPGQILAPIVVRELAAGKGFLLADLGQVALRGFEDPVRLYEVRWREED